MPIMASPKTDAVGDLKQDYHLKWPCIWYDLILIQIDYTNPGYQEDFGYCAIFKEQTGTNICE